MKAKNPIDASPPVQLDLGRPPGDWSERLSEVTKGAADCHGDVSAALTWCVGVGGYAPKPGDGRTVQLWEILASTASVDVGVARILEPHLDALAILAQADNVNLHRVGANADSTWGVYAAEGAEFALTASGSEGEWLLDGVKPWCSLARDVSHALVTAHTGPSTRRLFAVNMAHAGVVPVDVPWVSRGLQQVASTPVQFAHVPAVPVGEERWYLTRPGFAWGGLGVSACWWGGAIGVARLLYRQALQREPDQVALTLLGAVDTALNAARAALAEASVLVDHQAASAPSPSILARRVRNLVAEVAESTITHVGHALGPAPLALDEEHARRVADLQIYIRQHHAERDHAALGRDLVRMDELPW